MDLTKDNFEKYLKDGKPMLVDFHAPWCPPCNKMSPTVDWIAEQYEDQVIVGKVNIDEQNEIAAKYNISAIPAFLFFDENGNEVESIVGMQSKESLVLKLDKLLKKD